jgi:hypothetical protein
MNHWKELNDGYRCTESFEGFGSKVACVHFACVARQRGAIELLGADCDVFKNIHEQARAGLSSCATEIEVPIAANRPVSCPTAVTCRLCFARGILESVNLTPARLRTCTIVNHASTLQRISKMTRARGDSMSGRAPISKPLCQDRHPHAGR